MASQKQAPRLSGMLRAHYHPKEEREFDPDKEFIKRKDIFKKRVSTTKPKSQTSPDALLSWEFFAGKGNTRDQSLQEREKTYHDFLRSVSKILGDEVSSEELHRHAMFIYKELSADKPEGDKKKKIHNTYGSFGAEWFSNAAAMATELAEFKEAKGKGGGVDGSADVEDEDDWQGEFGKDMDLLFDSNFLLDIFVTQPKQQPSQGQKAGGNQKQQGRGNNNRGKGGKGGKGGKQQPTEYQVVAPTEGMWEGAELESVDENWLANQCERHIQISGGTELSVHDLSASILRILSDRALNAEQLQDQLFNLLGETGFEFIGLLIQKRVGILSFYKGAPTGGEAATARLPLIGNQFVVRTENDKFLEKLKRKEDRKRGRRGAAGAGGDGGGDYATQSPTPQTWDPQALRKQREEELNQGSLSLDALLPVGSTSDRPGTGGKNLLPAGTVRISKKTFDEVRVPYQKQQPLAEGERLVLIEEFDPWAQLAFEGYKSLNRIQSRIFEKAYRSNENLLICAPTGAGKTNVAMMAVLHQLGQFRKKEVLQKDKFKIVYVAPMKALAQEMVRNFGSRLAKLGVVVKELTGDMQLTRREITETQMIVTTPEKWDVITRKTSDMALAQLVKLLIIDEVHLLHEDRGPVIETLVARTIRQVESTQSMIRIVGLSATLPNHADVAQFLRVNPESGLFVFDSAYRPVPLEQVFIGVRNDDPVQSKVVMNKIAFMKAYESVKAGNQVMVFVHSRKGTVKSAEVLVEIAMAKGKLGVFDGHTNTTQYMAALKEVNKSRNNELKQLFTHGFGIHHAGMLRPDRNLTEKMFSQGLIKVLVCTATLAWGVNLPAHTVIIKGTELYDSKTSSFIELGMLDVMQIFGRAGRPQFDTSGEGIIITSSRMLPRYLALLNQLLPIESNFVSRLADNLNAEIAAGTVTNVDEAVRWLSYTYLFVRMTKNPLAYGITYEELMMDPHLHGYRHKLITDAAKTLDEAMMIRYNNFSGTLDGTHVGRVASHFYLENETISLFNEHLKSHMTDSELLGIVCQASEFKDMKVREEEMPEMKKLNADGCPIKAMGGPENKHGKVNILFQSYLSNIPIKGFALVSDQNYVTQNAGRIFRGLFEIVMQKGWTVLAERVLDFCKMCDLQLWDTTHPLTQFNNISKPILYKLQTKNLTLDRMWDMSAKEIGAAVDVPHLGPQIAKAVGQFPALELDAQVQPITRTVLRITLSITPVFEWNDKIHGTMEPWWIWVEDPETEHIYHHENFLLAKKQKDETTKLTFTIPIFEPLPSQYLVRAVSNRWLHAEMTLPLNFKHLILPHQYPPHTELLDLQPLPLSALHNPDYEKMYNFSHFNPVQTQIFHTAYHTDVNMLVGAPTGSGKTVAGELAVLRLFNTQPHMKAVYIAPLKALVRERMKDWNRRFVGMLGKKMVELTGDYTPDVRALQAADIVTTTPEKWDGISRNWQQRGYVKSVGLIIIDEVHLLGMDRGPILEVIVSRMRYISSHTDMPVRLVCLSTAIANARDLADWLGIEGNAGLFNFRPSVRPVPLEVHIQGYSGDHYCPRMATMNKPSYAAIMSHSPTKPVLVFVSSRRQTRLTALDLIGLAATNETPRQFLHMAESDLEPLLRKIKDSNLRHTLSFGVGLHHAGLPNDDKVIVEELFARNWIQILVSTSTLAWGVNLPAHLVVIKGTEFFDAKTKRYEDFPITDVLQMMGRAGRPQFDTLGIAVIMVHEPKKNFYKKFLYEPFPVESSLADVLHDHFNAEIISGTISSKQDAVDYLTWTYFFRRLVMNPTYYDLEETDLSAINANLSERVDAALTELEESHCIEIDPDDGTTIYALTFGKICSYYYLHHTTMRIFYDSIDESNDIKSLLQILANTSEYDELPVRHNEDKLNEELSKQVLWPADVHMMDDPHTKANLLLQAHFSDLVLPITDYITDTNSVLDQAIRILQAMVDVAADGGWLFTSLNCMQLMQMVMQGHWMTHSTLLTLPNVTDELVDAFNSRGVDCLPELLSYPEPRIDAIVSKHMSRHQKKEFYDVLWSMPLVDIKVTAPDTVKAGDEEEAVIKVEMILVNKRPAKSAYTPRFSKRKEAGWWLVLGNAADGELLALRRVSIRPRQPTRTSLTFTPPENSGWCTYYLYLMSDSYLGLDQQVSIQFSVEE